MHIHSSEIITFWSWSNRYWLGHIGHKVHIWYYWNGRTRTFVSCSSVFVCAVDFYCISCVLLQNSRKKNKLEIVLVVSIEIKCNFSIVSIERGAFVAWARERMPIKFECNDAHIYCVTSIAIKLGKHFTVFYVMCVGFGYFQPCNLLWFISSMDSIAQ